jgi:3-hydroxyacyl-[acyl-carrier-protein] dehydratase
VLNREAIEGLIPHRAPFLWIDEVAELSDVHVRGVKRLDPALDVFAGHYPHFPVLPGVLQCEAAFQAAAVLIARIAPPQDGKVPVVTRLNNVKFRRMVRPGETLDITVELTQKASIAYFFKGTLRVGAETACTLEFACALTSVEI